MKISDNMKRMFLLFALLVTYIPMMAENDKNEIVKTGINLGPLPVVAFDADRGFQYGALLNLYNFGDGSNYPNPNSSWLFEASAYTKGTAKLIVNHDNKTLIPGTRMSICSGYYFDKALDFYGFNGYQSIYDMDILDIQYADNEAGNKLAAKNKKPKGFYRHGRKMFKIKADFSGEFLKNLHWEAGYNFMWIRTDSFRPEGYVVENDNSLYSLYREWGIIPEEQANGGLVSAIRLGLKYDSRNVENNPTRGIWAEGHLELAPSWLGTSSEYYKFSLTMRQYIPIVSDKLTFAYRAGYEGFFGDAPWYILPFYTSMGPITDFDGYGGYRSIRGLMLNRLQGLHIGFYNAEIRWKFVDFKLWNQNIAFALSAFNDGGHVFKGYDITNKTDLKPELYKKFVNTSIKDSYHGSAGAGLRFIMNQNFIVAFEFAKCFNKQDGEKAFYINTGFLF